MNGMWFHSIQHKVPDIVTTTKSSDPIKTGISAEWNMVSLKLAAKSED
jgi:hypothetical protein